MITIQNLYYLLLYAWDAFDEGRLADIDAEPYTDLLNLLAAVLIRGVNLLLRRGPDRGYLPHSEVIPGVRGKLDLSATLKANLSAQARTICQFDELSYDVAHNQILKATLRRLLRSDGLDRNLRGPIRNAYQRLPAVSDVPLSRRSFRAVQLHRNIRFYRFLLHVCRLLFRQLIPSEATGEFRFRTFTGDERRMRRLFEHFLRNFYRHDGFSVRTDRIYWRGAGEPAPRLLPTMLTDVTLRQPGRWLIIDAKYTPRVYQSHHHGSQRLRSGHLYQLFAYLRNLPIPPDTTLNGLLLYPEAQDRVDQTYTVSGHRLRVYTINLNQHWSLIRQDLLRLIEPWQVDG